MARPFPHGIDHATERRRTLFRTLLCDFGELEISGTSRLLCSAPKRPQF